METITLKVARGLLARAVLTKGQDFIYNPGGSATCLYEPSTTADSNDPRCDTGCLVGVALTLHGFTEQNGQAGSVSSLASEFNWITREVMTRNAVDYFQEAQRSQDDGSTWGEAYTRAENTVH